MKRIGLGLSVAMLWACPERPVLVVDRDVVTHEGECTEASSGRQVDILFVIDNSRSMRDEQTKLREQFESLVGVLARFPGGFPDLHIGVTSTDLCDDEALSGKLNGTGLPLGVPYISIANANGFVSGNIPNVDTPTPDGEGCLGEVAEDDNLIDVCDIQVAFRAIASLGIDGCGFEQPLEAARRVLDCDRCNGGFLRDDSLLAVVFVGDEDDCSASDPTFFSRQSNFDCFEYGIACDQPIDREASQELTGCRSNEDSDHLYAVQTYSDFFATLRPAGRLVLAAIAGPHAPGDTVTTLGDGQLAPSCTAPAACDPRDLEGCQSAAPAIRLHELVRAFGDNGVILSELNAEGICADDYGPALARVGELIGRRIERRCIQGPLVRTLEGTITRIASSEQAACSVYDVSDGSVTPLPRCAFARGVDASHCPALDVSPGALAEGSEHPCWYVCDAGAVDEGGCEFHWELRLCRDPGCDPTTPAPAGSGSCAQCTTCEPRELGCLCGDGSCQTQVGEGPMNCPEDCYP